LNRAYRDNSELWELDHDPSGFRWIDSGNADQNIVSFLRLDSSGSALVVVLNFSGHPYHNFRIGLPSLGDWQEMLNSDSERYGGSGVTNASPIHAEAIAAHSLEQSAEISIPPLGGIVLKLV